MIIGDLKPFAGAHCETTATGTLLNHCGVTLSEPMLFGIGQGLGFIYWNMRGMGFPFLGGRIKPDILTENLATNLNLLRVVQETSSAKRAWANVASQIDANVPVGLKLDCYHLDYFTNKFHFAAHYVAMYGYDSTHAYLVDTKQQGMLVKVSLANLALARSQRGPMSSKSLSYTITANGAIPSMKSCISKAIVENARDYSNPPIQNMGFKGIAKAGIALKKWFASSKDPYRQLIILSSLMERAGTGGALFRNLYRDFLKEAMNHVPGSAVSRGYERFVQIAQQWSSVSALFDLAGTSRREESFLEACTLMNEISNHERAAMEGLRVL